MLQSLLRVFRSPAPLRASAAIIALPVPDRPETDESMLALAGIDPADVYLDELAPVGDVAHFVEWYSQTYSQTVNVPSATFYARYGVYCAVAGRHQMPRVRFRRALPATGVIKSRMRRLGGEKKTYYTVPSRLLLRRAA